MVSTLRAPLCALFFFVAFAAAGVSAQQTPSPRQPEATAPAAPGSSAPPAARAAPAARTTQPVDRIIAVVNDEVITANELRSRTLLAEVQLQRQKIAPPPQDVLARQVLERMIVDRAQLQLARETGVRVDDATVNAAMMRIAESNNITVPALRQRLEAEGISFAQFREDVRQDILLNRLREREVDSRLQVSDSEIDNFIADQAGISADAEEVNLAQILLRIPENATPQRLDETRQRADDLVAQLKGGADFARLAASYSNAAEALQGGELGWRNADRLPTLFIDAIKGVKTGEIAPIVRSPEWLSHTQGSRPPQRGRGQARRGAGAADPRAPHPAAGHRRHARARRQAPPGRVQGAHRGRADRIRHARAPALRRPERQPRR